MARILLVDDDAAVLDVLCDTLASKGHQIIQTSEADQAVALALKHRPALALLDYNMPALTGAEVLRDLRAKPETKDLPVIFLSAIFKPDYGRHVKPQPRVRYLSKPVSMAKLLAVVDELLAAG